MDLKQEINIRKNLPIQEGCLVRIKTSRFDLGNRIYNGTLAIVSEVSFNGADDWCCSVFMLEDTNHCAWFYANEVELVSDPYKQYREYFSYPKAPENVLPLTFVKNTAKNYSIYKCPHCDNFINLSVAILEPFRCKCCGKWVVCNRP